MDVRRIGPSGGVPQRGHGALLRPLDTDSSPVGATLIGSLSGYAPTSSVRAVVSNGA
jgi:hypothetical protein